MPAMDIDFVRPRRGPGPLAWLLLASGLLVAGLAALDWRSAQLDRQSAQEQAERQTRQAQRARPARAAAPTVAPDTLKAGQLIEVALNRPWGRWLSELESLSAAPVALIGLEAQPVGRGLRLTGEARHMQDALDYVARLRALPSARSALLVSHEIRRDGAVEVLRFAVDMEWRVSP